MKEKFLNFFKINDDYKISKALFIVMIVTSVLLFNILIINYHTNADGIIEGMYYYHNADWASTGCGRFLIRYMNYAFANNVMPLVNVVLYIICIYLSVLLITKLFDLKNKYSIYLIGIIMLASPTLIDQMCYMHVVLSFGISCLFSTLFVYFVFKFKPKYSIILSTLCLIIALGLYQSYLGYAAALVLLISIFYLLNNHDLKEVLNRIALSIISALLACIGYLGIYKLDLIIHHYEANDRAAYFSVSSLISSLPHKFIETYTIYFSYFNDNVLKRKYIYLLLFLLFLFIIVRKIITLVKDKKYIATLLTILMFALLPAASNIMGIVFPDFNVYLLMEYQNVLIIVMLIILVSDKLNIFKYLTYALVLLLSWTYIISATATYRCFELSYNIINKQYEQVLYDVYHTEGYTKDETPIVFIGYFNDDTIREELPLYRYTINYPKNVAYWEDSNGVTDNRYNYFLNYFGLNTRIIDLSEYNSLIENQEVKKMTTWPSSDSIKIINGYCVVKLS